MNPVTGSYLLSWHSNMAEKN